MNRNLRFVEISLLDRFIDTLEEEVARTVLLEGETQEQKLDLNRKLIVFIRFLKRKNEKRKFWYNLWKRLGAVWGSSNNVESFV